MKKPNEKYKFGESKKYQRKKLNALLHRILELRDQKCLRCGRPDFQAAHIHPKGRYRKLEFDPDNIIALCWNCHFNFAHKEPRAFNKWLEEHIPKQRLDRIDLRAQITDRSPIDYKAIELYLKNLIDNFKFYEKYSSY